LASSGAGAWAWPLVRSLLQAGHRVHAWDTSDKAMQQATAAGAVAVANAKEAFRGDAVLSMLPNNEAMRGVFLDSGVPPDKASSTKIHVNMATASVDCARLMTAEHARRGIDYVSAPVFGRPMAEERQLNILATGPAAAIDKVQPLFDALGRIICYNTQPPLSCA